MLTTWTPKLFSRRLFSKGHFVKALVSKALVCKAFFFKMTALDLTSAEIHCFTISLFITSLFITCLSHTLSIIGQALPPAQHHSIGALLSRQPQSLMKFFLKHKGDLIDIGFLGARN